MDEQYFKAVAATVKHLHTPKYYPLPERLEGKDVVYVAYYSPFATTYMYELVLERVGDWCLCENERGDYLVVYIPNGGGLKTDILIEWARKEGIIEAKGLDKLPLAKRQKARNSIMQKAFYSLIEFFKDKEVTVENSRLWLKGK